MAQNRTLPYGYKIENGRLTTQPQEEQVVVQIFQRYAQGHSYKKIADWLTESDIPYMPQKPQWNKNMVARILQNDKYLGTDKYPAILQAELYHRAEKQAKLYTHTESKDIKAIKPLLVCGECGQGLGRRLKATGQERWYCPTDTDHISIRVSDQSLMEDILALQQKLATMGSPKRQSKEKVKILHTELIKLKNQLDLAINEPTPNLEEIQSFIMELASGRYTALDDMTEDSILNHTIAKLSHRELNVKLLKNVIAEITVSHKKAMALILKNGKKIEY